MSEEKKKLTKIEEEQEERRLKEIETSERMKETLARDNTSVKEEDIPPAYIKGVPYRIIDGKYVGLDEAELIFQRRKVARETKKLEYLETKYGKK